MTDDWYCQLDRRVDGPMTSGELQRRAKTGKLAATDLVRKTETGKWVPAGKVKGLAFPVAAEPVGDGRVAGAGQATGNVCPSCGAPLLAGAVLCLECGHDSRAGKRHPGVVRPEKRGRKGLIVVGIGIAVFLAGAVAVYALFLRPGPSENKGAPAVAAGTGAQKGPPPVVPDSGAAQAGTGPGPAAGTVPPAAARPKPVAAIHVPAELVREIAGGGGGGLDAIIAVGTLPPAQVRKVNRRQTGWDKTASDNAVRDWQDALELGTSEKPEPVTLRVFLAQLDPLWTEDVFQPAVSERYVARIRKLPDGVFLRWQSVLEAVARQQLGRLETVGYILQFDRLFLDKDFQRAESEHLLGRAQSIPPPEVKVWGAAVNGKTVQAVLGLVGNDSLFDDQGRFDPDAAGQVLTALRASNDPALNSTPGGPMPGGQPAPAPPPAPVGPPAGVVLKIPATTIRPPYCEKKGVALLPEAEYKLVGERLGLLEKAGKAAFQRSQDAWHLALKKLLADDVDTLSRLYFALTLEPFWANGKFQPTVSDKYLGRFRQLTGEIVGQWQVEFNAVLRPNSSIEKFPTVGVLLQVDALFPGGALSAERSDQLRKRFQSIGPDARKAWFGVAGGDVCFSVLSLLEHDWLFTDDRFREDVFRQALAKAKGPAE